MEIKKVLFPIMLMFISFTSFGQRVIVDNSIVVPVDKDVHEMYREYYEFGFRLGKMYAQRDDFAAYTYAVNSTIDTRNRYADDYMMWENKLLGIVAGWSDNRIFDLTPVIDLKQIMHAPFGSGDAYRAYAGTNYYPGVGGTGGGFSKWTIRWDFNSFGIQVSRIHIL